MLNIPAYSAHELFLLIFSSVTIGLCFFCASLLHSQIDRKNFAIPLILFFFANGLAEVPIIFGYFTDNIIIYLMRLFFLLMLPCFWLYVRALTSRGERLFRRGDAVHFLPFFVSALAVLLLLALTNFNPDSLKVRAVDPLLISLSIVLALSLVLLPIIQFPIYAMFILGRIAKYHSQLKDMFSSTQDKELGFIYGIGIALFLYWVLHFGDLAAQMVHWTNEANVEIAFDRNTVWKTIANLLVVWTLALWSMRHSRVLADTKAGKKEKYTNSALNVNDLARIGQKIERAMQEKKIYLNPNLSLRDLSREINELPNYVSQALNMEIGKSFFDYVNGHRIAAAQVLIQTTDKTILDIAFETGFNSRSAFYRAFDEVVHMSPAAFRKAQKR